GTDRGRPPAPGPCTPAVAARAAAHRRPARQRPAGPAARRAGRTGRRTGQGDRGMSADTARTPGTPTLVVAAAVILMLTMGARQTTGLFVAPIHLDTGVGIATISLALAIGQFVWGAVQPVFGALADRHGSEPVLV